MNFVISLKIYWDSFLVDNYVPLVFQKFLLGIPMVVGGPRKFSREVHLILLVGDRLGRKKEERDLGQDF